MAKGKLKKILKQARKINSPFDYKAGELANKLANRQAKIQGKLENPNLSDKRQAKLENKLNKINKVSDRFNTTGLGGINNVTQQTNAALSDQLEFIKDQGQFNPQDYMQARQAASDAVMSEFDRYNNPIFQQQQDEFKQDMYNKGISPDNPLYAKLERRMLDNQYQQRQSALNNAYQLGANEQQTAFNQQYQTYQSPYQNMQALSPMYNANMNFYGNRISDKMQMDLQQNQQNFQSSQNQLDRDAQMRIASMRGAGGAAPPPIDKESQFIDQWIMQNAQASNQPKPPSAGEIAVGSFAQGFGQGVSNSIFSGGSGGA